jgi:hypothetical protein
VHAYACVRTHLHAEASTCGEVARMYHENAEWDWGRWSAAEKHSHLLKQRRELDEVDIVVGDRLLHHAEGGRQGGSADRSVWRLTPCSSCAVGAGPPAYVQTLKREAGGCPLRPKSSGEEGHDHHHQHVRGGGDDARADGTSVCE